MPNDIEALLSATADFLQREIDNEPDLRAELSALLNQGQRPSVIRDLHGVGPLAMAFIFIGRPL